MFISVAALAMQCAVIIRITNKQTDARQNINWFVVNSMASTLIQTTFFCCWFLFCSMALRRLRMMNRRKRNIPTIILCSDHIETKVCFRWCVWPSIVHQAYSKVLVIQNFIFACSIETHTKFKKKNALTHCERRRLAKNFNETKIVYFKVVWELTKCLH